MSNLSKLAWNEVDWKNIESRVFRLQRRIYKAKTEQKIDVVYYLQKKIIHGLNGKFLSIRKACKNLNIRIAKKLILHIPQKKIVLLYALNLQKQKFKETSFANSKKVLTFFETKKYEIQSEATEFLIKLALEPEWSRYFEINSMGHNLGQSYQDSVENVFSELKIEYVFHKEVFQNYKIFNKKRFLKKLNTIKIIEIKISKFLNCNTILEFRKKEAFFYNDFIFEPQQKSILAPLLCNIALTGLENYLTGFLHYYNSILNTKIKYFRYLNEILLIAENYSIISKAKIACVNYLNKVGSEPNIKSFNVLKMIEGLTFLGFQLLVLKKNGFLYKKISISKESKKLLLYKTRFIIQKNKSCSSYQLINKLTPIILQWGYYFQHCECHADFLQMDNRILNQLRAWVFRRKAKGKNRSFLKETYFPSSKTFKYKNVTYENNWVLCGELKIPNKKNIKNFLPKLIWLQERNYLVIKNNYSIYNGNYLYWYKRLCNLEFEQKFLLRKKFLFENKIEIYNLFTTLK